MKILIFILTVVIGTACLVEGFMRYNYSPNKKRVIITTSIILFVINSIGAISAVLLD